MTRALRLAAIQLEVTPAPTPERLARAQRLIEEAAQSGAQLIVLPEVFNTGYRYTAENYQRAEPIDGATVMWMKELAARLNVHLAGSILLRDHDDIYNALLLVAPDRQMWRYDKKYPWAWERAYFRAGRGITIAHTQLGDIGMMICWDCAHSELWQKYAGQIDLMLISSCPPDVSNSVYQLPDGNRVTFDDLGPLMRTMKGSAPRVFAEGINRQAAWLGVPVINTVGCGQFTSAIPNGPGSLLLMAPFAPWLLKYMPQAGAVQITCSMTPGGKIVNHAGKVVAQLDAAQGEAFVIGTIEITAKRHHPIGPQPASPVPWITYLASDVILPFISRPLYRRGVRALPDRSTRAIDFAWLKWLIAIGLSGLIGLWLAVLWQQRRLFISKNQDR